jgi:hypothetical protein
MPGFHWTQKQDFGPKARAGHSIAYDSVREKVVLFGGDSFDSRLFNDTWEWDGVFWTQVADMGPASRKDHSMCYDANNKRTLVFGGTTEDQKLGDTWIWDGVAWTQLSNSGPAPRSSHALIYNAATNSVILFGGESADLNVLGDTWEYKDEEWTQLDETGPSGRKFHAMAFDSIRQRVVLFGGASNNAVLGDTWEWDGANWSQTADFGPQNCLASSMTFTNSRATLYGGINSLNQNPAPVIFDNSWDWDGKHWTQRQDIGPGARWGHAMCFDNKRSAIVLFGGLPVFGTDGLAQKVLADTWEHIDSSTQPAPAPPGGNLSIISFQVQPGDATIAQVPGVAASIMLNAAVTDNAVTLPLFFLTKQLVDNPPLPPGTQPTPLPSIIIPPGSNTGQIQLGQTNITESVVIFVQQLNDPGTTLSTVLTIIAG